MVILYKGPQFRPDGVTILDFYLLWIEQAINGGEADRAADLVTKYVHVINVLTLGQQRPLEFGDASMEEVRRENRIGVYRMLRR